MQINGISIEVYASKSNDGTILKAPRPKDLFRNSIATPALVASIINAVIYFAQIVIYFGNIRKCSHLYICCVVVGRRSHRYASFLRLTYEGIILRQYSSNLVFDVLDFHKLFFRCTFFLQYPNSNVYSDHSSECVSKQVIEFGYSQACEILCSFYHYR